MSGFTKAACELLTLQPYGFYTDVRLECLKGW